MATEEISWSNIVFRSGTVTALHPVDYAKTLIQLGYEPIAAKPTRTFFGRPALGLPNVFQYSEKPFSFPSAEKKANMLVIHCYHA